MAQPPIQSTTLDKIIRAISTLKTKTSLLALGMVLLFLAFWLSIFLTQGGDRWLFGCIFSIGLIGIVAFIGALVGREISVPQIQYSEEYLLELLKRGYFFGDHKRLNALSMQGKSEMLENINLLPDTDSIPQLENAVSKEKGRRQKR